MTQPSFRGLRVGALESRNAAEIARLIERFEGLPHVSPSLREVPLEDTSVAVEFANRLITGQIDTVIFLTGVGFRTLLQAVERHVPRQRFLDALSDVVTVARGPKPVAAMAEVGLKPTHRVPEPNTWRDLLQTLDAHVRLPNTTVAVQEYGKSNASLIAGLESRGATVVSVRVYRWELPADTGPLEENVRALVARQRDVLLFTSAQQAHNLFEVAHRLGLADELRRALRATVIASIGPTTTETLHDLELPVDLEPEHPKMGHLVQAAAERAADLLAQKRLGTSVERVAESRSPAAGASPWHDSPFLRACRREPTEITPVWLMRQAGRYMEEYRAVRSRVASVLELCKDPALCSEVMCTAVRRLGVDAAIIFSDLLPILEPMGMDLQFVAGEGPVISNPVRGTADIDRVRELTSMQELEFVVETVRQTRRDLPGSVPLIGFAGSPFTLASYMIEGGSSRDYRHTKSLMYGDEGAWRALMERFVRSLVLYLNAQIDAGCQAVQLFDSWAGCLGPDDYRRFVLPHLRAIVAGLRPGVPVINFATGNPALLPLLAESGAGVIGVDWRVRLDDAWRTVGHDRAVQGNLDPIVLLSNPEYIRERAGDVLAQAARRPGHIFNLGHGVLQQTPVENAIALVDAVHELSAKRP